MVLTLVQDDLKPLLGSGWRATMTVRFVGGALFELLGWSVDARNAPTPEELDREFRVLTQRVLAGYR
jgi:hypothetical protein